MKKLLFMFSVLSWVAFPAQPQLLYEQDATLLTTSVHVVILTGASDDPLDKSGLTNLMGELMIRGTKKKSRSKFQSEVERLGASLNVRVGPDTILMEGRTIKENSQALLSLIEEALLTPAMSEKEFVPLKREILGQIRHRKNQNGRLAGLALRKEAFLGTPLERPLDGGLTTVKKITLADLVNGYRDRIHRGNVMFAVAGPLPEAEINKKLTAIWEKLPDGLRTIRKSVSPQLPGSPKLIVVKKTGTSTGVVFLGQAGITAQEPTRYALDVGNFSFGGEQLVSRLFKVIRGQLGWTYAVGSTYFVTGPLTAQPGLFVINSTPAVEFTGKTILKAMSMWREYHSSGLKAEEIRLGQESTINSYPFEFDSAEKRLGRKLHSYLYGVPTLTPEEYAKTLQGVTNTAIREALKSKHTAEGWIITVVADPKTLAKQLEQEQKDLPEASRLKISKVITPEEIID